MRRRSGPSPSKEPTGTAPNTTECLSVTDKEENKNQAINRLSQYWPFEAKTQVNPWGWPDLSRPSHPPPRLCDLVCQGKSHPQVIWSCKDQATPPHNVSRSPKSPPMGHLVSREMSPWGRAECDQSGVPIENNTVGTTSLLSAIGTSLLILIRDI